MKDKYNFPAVITSRTEIDTADISIPDLNIQLNDVPKHAFLRKVIGTVITTISDMELDNIDIPEPSSTMDIVIEEKDDKKSIIAIVNVNTVNLRESFIKHGSK